MTLKKIGSVCTICFICISFIFIFNDETYIVNKKIIARSYFKEGEPAFLVSSSKCKIINLDPFNEEAVKFYEYKEYIPCRKLDLLTYITKENNTAKLHVRNNLMSLYTKNGGTCCFSNIFKKSNQSDNDITITDCVELKDSITLEADSVFVKCHDLVTKKQIYENTHAIVTVQDRIKKKISQQNGNAISVLLIGIDSVSRLNLIRTMPNTYKFLEDNKFLPLKGYNKIGDNTFPNVMAFLTGYNFTTSMNVCNPNVKGKLDNCSFLWYDYRKLGHVTAYAEDDPTIGTFNYQKKGFSKAPTDYYFRPYMLASEKMKTVQIDRLTYCAGPETSGEKIMSIAKDFSSTFANATTFGYFWMNTFSHSNLNMPSTMDKKVTEFMEDLSNNGEFNKSIVIFISDHGMRWGGIRNTFTGWLEERLPYIYFSFPRWFKTKFPNEYNNFKGNEYRLTTPYDLYMTLQHILVLSGYDYMIKSSDACPKCQSLFEKIPVERSCEDAAIEPHYCTCSNFKKITLSSEIIEKITYLILKELNQIITKNKNCLLYKMKKILSTSASEGKKQNTLLIRFETKPEAIFETTVTYTKNSFDNFNLFNSFSRLDEYNNVSNCVNDALLKKYCYCQN